MVQDHNKLSVAFSIVLYNGEREIDVGHINIHESLIFKQFQMMLKEAIGISYNNLTTYLVEKGSTYKMPSERKKVLITGKVNFSSLILQENSNNNCYFLVVLKRSRRDRKKKVGNYSYNVSKPSVFGPLVGHEPLGLVMKNVGNYDLFGYGCKFDAMKWSEDYGYCYSNSGLNAIFRNYSGFGQGRALCKDCMKAEEEGKKAGFHFCVYDDVVESGFRSPVGPICRPR